MASLKETITNAERDAKLLPGDDERFSGWGVMGLPFRSGDVFAFRSFAASSVGPGYTSVWYRDPGGHWTFFADTDPHVACTRFFGSLADRAVNCPISVEWKDDNDLRIAVPEAQLTCEMSFQPSLSSRTMNLVGSVMPERAWRSPRTLVAMSSIAGPLLRAGKLAMAGKTPNGQDFIANPRRIWVIRSARITVAGRVADQPGPVRPQARLGDFRIPQRGILAIGTAAFETFDPARHSDAVCKPPA